MTTHANTAFSQAEAWVETNVARRSVVLTDDDAWTDLVDTGFSSNRVIWFWEMDLDPAVRSHYPGGWREIGWVVCTQALRVGVIEQHRALPIVVAALAHSRPVARFGSGADWVEVRQVVPAGPAQPPWWLPGYGSLKPPTSGPQAGERL